MVNFRKSVTHKADRVWDNNYGKDLYTGKRRDHYEGENVRTEVDHIMECQLGEHMWEKAFDGRMTTRSRLAAVVELWNDVDNLNVTQKKINQPKGSAFKAWKAGTDDTLRDALLRYNVAANHRAKICVAFEEAGNRLAGKLDGLADNTGIELYGDMAVEMEAWVNRTG
ncbi:hypothetical protein CHLRE_04g228950v5 [Chlamydomonas reinhardtii]|uniref:Uncharacterized protein n=1 Tax=Chlamydomonas reinhardtii TaxID=3055 RepID=A8ITD8_CHLRE|nr:uncharacterized protein CHLRE_04g228950v5 [Chlamydomonas reinhardtii]PNW84303.1 hypothetical protein CHLRE_04g228950v5 [Chlamydomonas reinhardtii]|eukprot:XP_001692242.1 predicted protein [Chlamydomonas reinhardtii]